MKTIGPTREQFDFLAHPFTQAVAAVAVLLEPDARTKDLVRRGKAITDRMDAHDAAVQGNRLTPCVMTWGDARLIIAGYLRILLEELEKSE